MSGWTPVLSETMMRLEALRTCLSSAQISPATQQRYIQVNEELAALKASEGPGILSEPSALCLRLDSCCCEVSSPFLPMCLCAHFLNDLSLDRFGRTACSRRVASVKLCGNALR